MTAPRTVVLVGATSGIGRKAADVLAERGHRLILIGRDPERVKRLAAALPAADVIAGDVATARGVADVVEQVHAATDRIDTLVNNAGVMVPVRRTTAEGHELNLAVHHLAPYSLTSGLLPLLRRGDGRVVNVNSEGHRAPLRGAAEVRIDFADLDSERAYDPFLVYSRTKLANLLFTYELQTRHPELTAVAVHPGMVRTSLGREWPVLQVRLMGLLSLSAHKGAEPLVHLATAPRVHAGGYYNRLDLTRSSPNSYDMAATRRLWQVTEELRGPFGG